MEFVFFNNGTELLASDHNLNVETIQKAIFDRLLSGLLDLGIGDFGFAGEGLKVSSTQAGAITVKKGIGVYNRSGNFSARELRGIPCCLDSDNTTLRTAGNVPSNVNGERSLYVRLVANVNVQDGLRQTRNFKTPGSDSITTNTFATTKKWSFTLSVQSNSASGVDHAVDLARIVLNNSNQVTKVVDLRKSFGIDNLNKVISDLSDLSDDLNQEIATLKTKNTSQDTTVKNNADVFKKVLNLSL